MNEQNDLKQYLIDFLKSDSVRLPKTRGAEVFFPDKKS